MGVGLAGYAQRVIMGGYCVRGLGVLYRLRRGSMKVKWVANKKTGDYSPKKPRKRNLNVMPFSLMDEKEFDRVIKKYQHPKNH